MALKSTLKKICNLNFQTIVFKTRWRLKPLSKKIFKKVVRNKNVNSQQQQQQQQRK
jgi:hypothetical protein